MTTAIERGGTPLTAQAGTSAAPRRRLRDLLAMIHGARGIPRVMFYTGAAITAVFVILAVFAPLIAPYGFAQYQTHGVRFPKLGAPSAAHWFGTNVISTDVLSIVIHGSRTELEVVAIAVVLGVVGGVPLGLVSGYFGGWLDRVLVLIMDAMFAFPYLLLAIVIAFLLSGGGGGGVFTAAVAIAAVYIPQYFRVLRNATLTVREEVYVDAARALGARPVTIMVRYIAQNVIQSVPVIATLNAADAILTLAGLGFLGFGIQPSQGAEWGYELQRAISDVSVGIWWTALFPGLAIIVLVTGLTLVGEGLNDITNPLLRRRTRHRIIMPARGDRS